MQLVKNGLSGGARKILGIAALLLLALAWRSLYRLMWQLVFALLLTMLALPICRRMEKKWKRPAAALCSVAVLLLTLAGMIILLVPPLLTQIRLIIAQAPGFIRQLLLFWEEIRNDNPLFFQGLDPDAPAKWLNRAALWIGESLPGMINGVAAGFDALTRGFLSPLLAYYFLRDRETFAYQISLWIPLRHRKRMLAALQEMKREAGGYLRGQLLVSLAVGALTAVGLLIVGIPAWLVLGLLMGLCEFIPYVGPFLGGIPIAVFSLPLGISTMLWALGVTVAIQQIEGFFLSPFFMSGATGLHPVSVVLLLSAGGLLAGLPGMMAALPAFLCLRGGCRVLFETSAEKNFLPGGHI